TLTVTDDAGLTGQSTATKSITTPSAAKVILTFRAFDADDFENGVGELQVSVNGNLVVDIPAGLNHLTGSGDYSPYTQTWVSFGPFDISSFITPGKNIITFTNPLADHFELVGNIRITSNGQQLLSFRGARPVILGRSLTLAFPSDPLIFTSLTASP